MPTALKPPVSAVPQTTPATAAATAPLAKKPCCTAEFDPKDQSLVVQFTVSPEMAKRFVRQANGRDLASFLWETRGLRHFEHQPLI